MRWFQALSLPPLNPSREHGKSLASPMDLSITCMEGAQAHPAARECSPHSMQWEAKKVPMRQIPNSVCASFKKCCAPFRLALANTLRAARASGPRLQRRQPAACVSGSHIILMSPASRAAPGPAAPGRRHAASAAARGCVAGPRWRRRARRRAPGRPHAGTPGPTKRRMSEA